MDNHKLYTAEDFLRYAHGQMPVAEQHALEKAALEDPFLAEALDGYLEQANAGSKNKISVEQNNIPQLQEVRAFINEKAADKKIKRLAPITYASADKWLQRMLAAIIIIGGGWWLFSISNTKKETATVAKIEQIAPAQTSPVIDSAFTNNTKKPETADNPIPSIAPKQEQAKALANETIAQSNKLSGSVSGVKVTPNPVAAASVPILMADSVAPSKDIALNEVTVSPSQKAFSVKKEDLSNNVVVGYGTQKKSEAVLQNMNVAPKPSFVFQGRITDANNNPLPFSNIMVPTEDFGTYADGQGYFNFVYTDSILPVRAKSLGFETQNFNMLAGKKENKIVLGDDKNLDKNLAFFRSAKQKKSVDYKPTIIKIDSISSSVEPFVGWRNYDLYLANNSRISDLPQLNSRSVQLSFEVAKNGEIKNITVEKSQGKDLDAEAIRLLKEGPKWKVKKNGEKGKIEVKF